MNTIVPSIRNALKKAGNEKARESFRNFFKEPVSFYGVKAAEVRRIGRDHFKKCKGKTKAEIFAICEDLLKSKYFEESMIAFEWADRLHKIFEESDFFVLEKWLKRYVDNWAACDTLCNHAMGSFIEKYPHFLPKLKLWAQSKNRWERRAAAVTLILPARKGMFQKEVFEIADILLVDSDDLVQKGYGWMLKEASRAHEKEVFEYVVRHRDAMPRTALRYAIEKMPRELRKKAMA